MTKIIVKLERDQAATIVHKFFPFLDRLCISKITNSYTDDEQLVYTVIHCIFQDVQKMFAKKLFTEGNRFTFNLSKAEGITLYKLLMAFPIDSKQVYMLNLRQLITDSIHNQLTKPAYEKESLPQQV